MVVLAQLAEHRIVVPSVVGSSPTFHPWCIARLLPRLNKNIPLGMFFLLLSKLQSNNKCGVYVQCITDELSVDVFS